MTQNTKVFTSKLHNSDTKAELLKPGQYLSQDNWEQSA